VRAFALAPAWLNTTVRQRRCSPISNVRRNTYVSEPAVRAVTIARILCSGGLGPAAYCNAEPRARTTPGWGAARRSREGGGTTAPVSQLPPGTRRLALRSPSFDPVWVRKLNLGHVTRTGKHRARPHGALLAYAQQGAPRMELPPAKRTRAATRRDVPPTHSPDDGGPRRRAGSPERRR